MTEGRSDALVLFGATGDLAHKKIFPALYAMVVRGALTEPVIGVALDAWDLAQLQARAHDGIAKALGSIDEAVFAKLAGLLRYVSGDYRNQATFDKLKESARPGPTPAATTSPFRRACSSRWSRAWSSPAAQPARG